MINYSAVVTTEEIAANGFKDLDSYLESSYPNIIIDEAIHYGKNIHVTARIPQEDYVPLTGQYYETTSFEEIRKEIQEQFS